MLKRNARLLNRKIVQYLIPASLMVFAMQFGSLLEGILVGNMVSGEALTVTGLVMPVLLVVQFPGFALSIGGAIVIGNYLGKREREKADEAFSVCLLFGTALSLIFALLAFPLAGPLAGLYTPPEMTELGREYIFLNMLIDPILTLALLFSSFMSTDNHPHLGSALIIIASVTKLGLELLFLGPLQLGLTGAALSTGIGYLIGLAVTLVLYCRSDRRMLHFRVKSGLKPSALKESTVSSAAEALNFLLNALQMSVANILIARLVTDPSEQILFGVMANFVFGFELFAGGVKQLVPTFCAVFHGEEDYYSLKSSARTLFGLTCCITAVIMVLILISPTLYCRLFGFDYQGSEGLWIMRLYVLSFLPYEINEFIQVYYPSIGETRPSVLSVILSEIILPLPLLFWLLHAQGLKGYALAMTLTEFGTVLLTWVYVLWQNKKRGQQAYGIWMIPPFEARDVYDVSIGNTLEESAALSREIVSYAQAHHMNERDAQIIGLAAEEIADNIVNYGYKNGTAGVIDASLKIVENKMVLRLRDDGTVFDPTSVKEDESTDLTSGLHLVRGLVERIFYLRVFNTNNTIMEIDLDKGGKA